MLDVHPPHSPTHTWKDFFIHIATIVIGLLIAVGLEQTVEYFHHRSELAETRKALALERDANKAVLQLISEEYSAFVPRLVQNIAIYQYVKAHPGAPPETWPGKLVWGQVSFTCFNAAWKTAQQGSVLQYMPQKELRLNAQLYDFLDGINADKNTEFEAFSHFVPFKNPLLLTPAQIDQALDVMNKMLTLEIATRRDHANLRASFPDFPPEPAPVKLPASFDYPTPTPPEVMSESRKLVDRFIKIEQMEYGKASESGPMKSDDSSAK